MSFVNRMLASVGIGAAKVDTILDKDTYSPGETITGTIKIVGGNADQKIDHINLYVMTEFYREVNDKKVRDTAAIEKTTVGSSLDVKGGSSQEIPFSLQLPYHTPYTLGRTPVWIKTGLDVQMAVDPTDNDQIRVQPDTGTASIFNAIEQLGFRLRKATCEAAPRFMRRRLPFLQEFEYVPASGAYRGKLDELEVIFVPQTNSIELLMEIDKRGKGLFGMLEEAMDLDERKVRLSFTRAELQDLSGVKAKIEGTLRQYS
ncbi:sporulation protein [Fictibacillus phosphorivorans]|uniref:sporulation protein n=1 Tax=Fictibacillus phosphorivorans TaxID=1221500 RepID=UPI0020413410|nr:sporulation protein [Fictibacillus phosphorivorans]MCM3720253.1 sporulation protein [Fictibacillus phosphorivorans]MCM3777951.1 sporulation protein [Fictibacillus phosphorivorans]